MIFVKENLLSNKILKFPPHVTGVKPHKHEVVSDKNKSFLDLYSVIKVKNLCVKLHKLKFKSLLDHIEGMKRKKKSLETVNKIFCLTHFPNACRQCAST